MSRSISSMRNTCWSFISGFGHDIDRAGHVQIRHVDQRAGGRGFGPIPSGRRTGEDRTFEDRSTLAGAGRRRGRTDVGLRKHLDLGQLRHLSCLAWDRVRSLGRFVRLAERCRRRSKDCQ